MLETDTRQLIVSVQHTIDEILRALGNPEEVAANALRRYILDACLQRIENAERAITLYEKRYQSDYATFSQKVSTDQGFLNQMHTTAPTWEADAIEWEYRIEEKQAWRDRLEKAFHEL